MVYRYFLRFYIGAFILCFTEKTYASIDLRSNKGLNDICRAEYMPLGVAPLCDGFLIALLDFVKFTNVPHSKSNICIPNEATLEGIRKVYLHWVESHPAVLLDHSSLGFIAALNDAYPCVQADLQQEGSTLFNKEMETLTNQGLSEICKNFYEKPSTRVQGYRQGKCIGYLEGARDALALRYFVLRLPSHINCIPNDASLDQIRKIFLKWSENHPEKLHENALSGFDQAIQEGFPCLQNALPPRN